MYSIEIKSKALKFLESCEKELKERLSKEIDSLKSNPFPKDVKRVVGVSFEGEKTFRVRVGDYRILYYLKFNNRLIVIFKIDKRSKVYG